MVKIEKLNRVLKIDESDLEEYIRNGYTICSDSNYKPTKYDFTNGQHADPVGAQGESGSLNNIDNYSKRKNKVGKDYGENKDNS